MSIGSKARRDRKRKREEKRARSRASQAMAERNRGVVTVRDPPPHQQKHVQNFTTGKAEDNLALVQRLRAIVVDLEQHGLRINRAGRIYQYIRDLEQFEARTTALQDPAEIKRFVAARMDGELLADTFDALRGC